MRLNTQIVFLYFFYFLVVNKTLMSRAFLRVLMIGKIYPENVVTICDSLDFYLVFSLWGKFSDIVYCLTLLTV